MGTSREDPRFLEFTNGSPFFAIGQNLAFIGENQYVNLTKAEEIFGKLNANGARSRFEEANASGGVDPGEAASLKDTWELNDNLAAASFIVGGLAAATGGALFYFDF